MAKTGKGLPRSLQNVDFGDFDIPVTPATTSVVGGVKKSATVAAPAAITAAAGVQQTPNRCYRAAHYRSKSGDCA
ncbi:TPA: hypothetical protein RJ694_004309 [Escherichia coli]|nr:hypothetical protein [Escherichia coli]